MDISVEDELSTTGPIKLDHLQNWRLIIFIGHVSRINEEEAPVFLLGILLPQESHHMDAALYHCLHPSTQFICTTRLLSLLYRHLQHKLSHQLLKIFSHPNRPHSRILIDSDQAARHECEISGPWGPLICQPLRKIRDNLPQLAA